MTVNKLTYPSKENAVQEKINEIIDNLGTSITVDQTYDGTSANPQSGVAIAGAGFLTGINSSDVTTALGYTPVNKSGDTMTGQLKVSGGSTFTSSVPLSVINTDIIKGTAPANNNYWNIVFTDANGTDDINNRTGSFETKYASNGSAYTVIRCYKPENGVQTNASLLVGYDTSGNAYSSFPNTTCVDGQWTNSYNDIISSDTSLNGSSSLPKRVPVPNDGYDYEVLLIARATTGTTSGNLVRVGISSNVLTNSVLVCSARTRSGSSVECQGTVVIPIKGVATNSTNLDIDRSTGLTGNLNVLRLIAYRRIGTNS